jgi:aminoglycoside phosphotransferase (APT) family kinase protein
MSDVELTEVRAAHRFDEQALTSYLATHVPDFAGAEQLTVRQFEGGQSNPTFQLQLGSERYVLRKQPPGELLPSAHQVDREFRVMHALHDTDVPVPEMICLCEDPSIIGTKFYVMEMVEGRLFAETLLPSLTASERRAIYLDLARVLACLHNVDPAATTTNVRSAGGPSSIWHPRPSR